MLETRGGPVRLVRADELQIRGPHNVSNALAAAAAAHALGVTPAALRARSARPSSPSSTASSPRAWSTASTWFNDSKATNPDAVLKALTAFSERPLIVLLGGSNKGNDFAPACGGGLGAREGGRPLRRGAVGSCRGIPGSGGPRGRSGEPLGCLRGGPGARGAGRRGRALAGVRVLRRVHLLRAPRRTSSRTSSPRWRGGDA